MTIIAWDGTSLAADCQSSVGDMAVKAKKIQRRADGTLVALAGDEGLAIAMVSSVFDGTEWPTAKDDERATMVIVRPDRSVVQYTHHRRSPVPITQPWYTWGSGREFAAGALAMGADARRAAEVACELCHYCGMGVQVERAGIQEPFEVTVSVALDPDSSHEIKTFLATGIDFTETSDREPHLTG